MLNVLRTHWTKIAAGLLLTGALGAGAYQRYFADCCSPGSPCCYPGSPCCNSHQVAER